MAAKRKRGEPADPIFAAEMEALAEGHRGDLGEWREEWKARLQRGLDLPPELQPTQYHRHEEDCYEGPSRISDRQLLKRFCRVTGQWVGVRAATDEEIRTAYARGTVEVEGS